MSNSSRRSFLKSSTIGFSAGWVSAHWAGILDATAFAAEAGPSTALAVFSAPDAADIDAVTSQIIPTDETPGAHEARCAYFIDRALTTFLRDTQPVYIQGLRELKAKCRELFPAADRFSSLQPDQQIKVLTAIEQSHFFATVRLHTILGFFSAPVHGGNHEKAGWKLIGYDDSMNFQPPFGYYDRPASAKDSA